MSGMKKTENRARKFDVRTPYGYDKRKLKLENMDPNFHYRWGLIDDPERLGRSVELQEYGFEMVKGNDPVKTPNAVRTDSMVYLPSGKGGGKLALFKMPMEIKKYHDEQREKFVDEQIYSRNSNDKNNPESLSILGNSDEGV